MQRATQRVILVTLAGILCVIALYPDRQSIDFAATNRVRPMVAEPIVPHVPQGNPMPTYRPPAGSTERMPVARPGYELPSEQRGPAMGGLYGQ